MVFEKKTPMDMETYASEIVKRVDTNTRRIRTMEQRFSGMEMRVRGLQEKIIEEIDNLRRGFDQISTDMKALTKNLTEIREEMLKMTKSLDKTAKKAELKELESLIDLYSPIKSKFVTKEEVRRIIEESKKS